MSDFVLFVDNVARDQQHLNNTESQGQAEQAKDLEVNPKISSDLVVQVCAKKESDV
jgi:hypothetical protein